MSHPCLGITGPSMGSVQRCTNLMRLLMEAAHRRADVMGRCKEVTRRCTDVVRVRRDFVRRRMGFVRRCMDVVRGDMRLVRWGFSVDGLFSSMMRAVSLESRVRRADPGRGRCSTSSRERDRAESAPACACVPRRSLACGGGLCRRASALPSSFLPTLSVLRVLCFLCSSAYVLLPQRTRVVAPPPGLRPVFVIVLSSPQGVRPGVAVCLCFHPTFL